MQSRKPIPIVIIFLLAFAQVNGQYRFYNYNPMLINPAFAAVNTKYDFHLQYLRIKMGTKDYPWHAITALAIKVPTIRSGIGMIANITNVGSFRERSASMVYNYQIEVNEVNSVFQVLS